MNKKRTILKIVLLVMIIGICVSLGGLAYTYKQYSDSRKAYNELEQYVEVETKYDISDVVTVEPISEPEAEGDGQAEEQPQKVIDVKLQVDTSSLKEINPDYLGWILYEPVEINYPVVRDRGDDFYEHHSFELENNRAGGIFMDYACKPNFDSFNTIIYGHNMRDGSMFGGLKKLVNDTSIIEENPYFYIFTEDYSYMYKIVCVYYAGNKAKTYDLKMDYTLEDKKEYIDYIGSVGTYRDEEFFAKEVTDDLRIVTLSTCHGLNSSQRTVIHGELVAKEQR